MIRSAASAPVVRPLCQPTERLSVNELTEKSAALRRPGAAITVRLHLTSLSKWDEAIDLLDSIALGFIVSEVVRPGVTFVI